MGRAVRVLAAVGAALGAIALLQRGRRETRERVDLRYDDGSVISLGASTPEAQRLMPLARRVLASARG